MSERSSRHYADATGLTPARAIERLRVEGARHLLSETGCRSSGFHALRFRLRGDDASQLPAPAGDHAVLSRPICGLDRDEVRLNRSGYEHDSSLGRGRFANRVRGYGLSREQEPSPGLLRSPTSPRRGEVNRGASGDLIQTHPALGVNQKAEMTRC